MDNKSELSKPVAWKLHYYGQGHYFEENAHVVALAESMRKAKGDALYSQEYVSALLAELKSSQAIANEYQQLMYHMDAGGDFYEFQRDKAVVK